MHRARSVWWKLMLVTWCATLLGACQRTEQPGVTTANAASHDQLTAHEAGRKIYNFRCYYCHGYSGDAKTLASSYLDPKPVAFREVNAGQFSRQRIIDAIREGRVGTAMASFRGILTPREIELVADFVREEFMVRKAVNTRYHTAENGWPNHDRYRDAYVFATGEIGIDTPWEQLTTQQAGGKRLYLGSCVSCHDRGRVSEDRIAWELRAVSYPPNQDSCLTCHGADGRIKPSAEQVAHTPQQTPIAVDHTRQHPGSPSPYARHDIPPQIAGLTPQEHLGEQRYQKNCAFCHAADGTGRNWIGAFLEPHPRDFTDARAMAGMTDEKLLTAIREGVAGSSMPAWKAVLAEDDIQAVAAYVRRAFYPGRRASHGKH